MARQSKNRFVTPCCIALGCILSVSIAAGAVATSFTASAETGAETTLTDVTRRYTSDYSSKDDVVDAALDFNVRVAEEGMVLMENNGILPLRTNWAKKTKVSVFGYAAVSPSTGGSEDLEDRSGAIVRDENDVFGILEDAGYAVNPTVRKFYEDNESLGSNEAIANAQSGGIEGALEEMAASYKTYGDAAVVVIGEDSEIKLGGGDAPAGDFPGGDFGGAPFSATEYLDDDDEEQAASTGNYGTAVDESQRYTFDADGNANGTTKTLTTDLELVKAVTDYFDDVIVVLNTAIPVEMGEIDDMYQEGKISAIIDANEPGNDGLKALGSLMNGDVNFSGHTSDIWARWFDRTPSTLNMNSSYYLDENGDITGTAYDEYEEGIYIGYRYYETVAYEMNNASLDGNAWYEKEVVYPFGYGLSYTDFTYEIVGENTDNVDETNVDKDIRIDVKVTNTGDYAGKGVAQLYYSAPYNSTRGIEMSYVVLGDYAKTDTLKPGESEIVTVSISPREMASYDSNLSNSAASSNYAGNDGAGGYVLEAGDYSLMIMEDSHNAACDGDGNAQSVTWTIGSEIDITESETGYVIENQLSDLTEHMAQGEDKDIANLSREDFANENYQLENWGFDVTKIITPANHSYIRVINESGEITDTWTDLFDGTKTNATAFDYTGNGGTAQFQADFGTRDFVTDPDSEADPWYSDTMPTQADEATRPATAEVVLSDLIGLDYDDPLWDTLLNELTLEEMATLIDWGAFYSDQIDYIEKPYSRDTDGNAGWTGSGTDGQTYPCIAMSPMIASTFSTELLYEMGIMLGEEGLWGSGDTDENAVNYSGWYSPSINIHRSYFDSRFYQYYSEDPYLTGTCASALAVGAAEKGVYVYLKHLACFGDMQGLSLVMMGGTDCDGTCNWLTEQTMREIYLKAFQIGIEEGGATGIMVTFSRIGCKWVGASYNLMTNIIKNEWGFRGTMVTDSIVVEYFDVNSFIRAGGNLMLRNGEGYTELDPTNSDGSMTATQVTCMREATHGILYTVANSNAMQPVYGAHIVISSGDVAASLAVGDTYSSSVDAAMNTYTKYGDITYSVTGGVLPDGITLNAATGELSGTATKAGTYVFEITASATFYDSASVQYVITVTDTASSGSTGDTGAAGADGRGIASMTINSDGELVVTYTDGTTDNLGTVVGADATATGVASVTQSGTQLVITYADGSTSYIEMNVTVDEEGNVVVGVASMEIKDGDLYVYYTDGTSQNLGTVVGADGKDGEDGSGCGSAVELAGAAIVMAIVLAAAAAVYAVSRKRRNISK